uniref:G-protein coupled receptors family 2 profile 2 domain-containing protein n=1 Tax=Panagrolaimus davidi TaxID=227884 RepID=A0A914QKD6_9BILA
MDQMLDENDLHISKYRIAKFTATSFEDAGTTVTKNTKHYTAECPDGTCTLIADGNPTEPTICNTTTKTTQNIVIGIGIALAAIAVISLIFQSDYFAVVSRVLQIFFSVFNDKNLPKRVKFFAYCYNITFMLYSIYLIFIAQQEDSSDKMCTAFAIVGYILYISAIFLSIIMLIITLEVLGCWKPAIRNSLYIFTGNQMIVLPFIHSYGIPLLITGGFAWAFTSFFKRNDGYCWIRPDYAFPALWIPLILLLLTIPLYIILIARRWANVGFFKMIYRPLTVPEEIALYEELRRKKEDQEKEEDIEDFKKKILGKSYQPNGNAKAEEEKTKDEKIILTSRTIARLMIPQMFLAIPLASENMALYYAHVTGWHYLFLLTQGLQAIVLNGIDWLEDLPDKFEDFKDRLSALRGSPKEVVPEETRWGTDNQNPKNGDAANSTRM